EMRVKTFLFLLTILWLGSIAYGANQPPPTETTLRSGKCFLYTAKKFGVPILKAAIKIENGTMEQGKPSYQVCANVESLQYYGLFFRMNNRFTSTVDREACFPVRYVKEIDQEGLLIKRKNYIQTFTFDHSQKKVVVKKHGENGKQEISLPPETYDPLSIFARYYLRDELHPGKDIPISLYDGIKLRQMVFHSMKERVRSRMYGEVEAVCLKSTTPFSSFGDQEGTISIWYLDERVRIPLLMELGLPVGNVTFELEAVEEI
ncbi:MAG: hypothetical protein H6Q48_3315, partial [Deltaproteobacteria bacterium]|nr:hypothetical protein [Deltaproteobacteria bacterium]